MREAPTPDLVTADLHGSLEDPALTSMNFLNEVTGRYPHALSFAPGRPVERFFDLESVHRRLRTFGAHLSDELGYSEEEVRRTCASTAAPRASCTTSSPVTSRATRASRPIRSRSW